MEKLAVWPISGYDFSGVFSYFESLVGYRNTLRSRLAG